MRGRKNSNTFRCVKIVSRAFRSKEYLPAQWKVSPAVLSRPSRSMPRPRNAAISFSPKSSPTTATRFTGAKNDAATEKKEALPPSTRSARPNGVSTVSYATLPTTRIDIRRSPSSHVFPDDGGQVPLDLRGHELRRRDQGV